MDLFYWAMLGGLVGTVMMDITERIAGKLKIPWGDEGEARPSVDGSWAFSVDGSYTRTSSSPSP